MNSIWFWLIVAIIVLIIIFWLLRRTGDSAPSGAATPGAARDSVEAFAEGLGRAYRRGRRRWKSATSGDDPNPRRWERDVRDLGDQLELLAAAWPEVITAAVAGCTDLAATLSDDMGYTALQRSVGSGPWPADEAEHSLLTALCNHTSSELAEISIALGARIYAETPSAFVTRVGSYWATRH